MAILKDGKFGVEIKVKLLEDNFAHYYFTFTYNSLPLFNPAMPDYDRVFEYDAYEYLLIFFQNMAQMKQSADQIYWIAANEKVHIQGRLFYAPGWQNYFEGPIESINCPAEQEAQLKQMDEQRDKNSGMLPDDIFEITFSIFDEKFLRSGDQISGTGPAIRLLVRRDVIQKFVAQLKKEYEMPNLYP